MSEEKTETREKGGKRFRLTLILYRALLAAASPFLRPYLKSRAGRGKEDPSRLQERFGHSNAQRSKGRTVWIHAASVGESLSVLPLIDRLNKLNPHFAFVVTTGTTTSARLLEQRLPERAVHQYIPFDRRTYITRFLDRWQPDAAIWVESEFWPVMLSEISERNIPLALVNARLSEDSYGKWQRFPAIASRMMASFDICLAQDDVTAQRLSSLGARDVRVPGNLKFSAPPLPDNLVTRRDLSRQIGKRTIWLAAQTADPEESQVALVHMDVQRNYPDLLTIIAPRHPERGEEIVTQLRSTGLKVAQRSQGERIQEETQIYVADTMGELGIFYRLANIVFLGRSLFPGAGGSNPLEPARLECAIIQGPYTENFDEITQVLNEAEATRNIEHGDELGFAVKHLLDNQDPRIELITAAEKASAQAAHAVDRAAEALLPMLLRDGMRELLHESA